MLINQSISQSVNQNLLYRSDCKEALLHLIDNKVKVDLIYLDPPFNSSRTYNIIFSNKGVTGQQKAFHDMWTMTAQNRQLVFDFEQVIEKSEDISESLKLFLKAWLLPLRDGDTSDKRMLVYLVYMTERLVLMKKVLKDTGSIYFHCDPTASHYIKIIMDGIFGRDNFKNEICWCYTGPRKSIDSFTKKHDIILFYTKSKNSYFIPQRIKHKDGVHNTGQVFSSSKIGQLSNKKKMEEQGKLLEDWWIDIWSTDRYRKEYLGYQTQKPIKLLDRIIKASCHNNGVVLDPFCGCGTTIESAIKNNIKWIGVDISSNAVEVIRQRIDDIQTINDKDYKLIDGSPVNKGQYYSMDAFQKQDWLINKIGGFPNPKKSGDGGVDGEMTIHLGFKNMPTAYKDEPNQKQIQEQDVWGKMVFSVKTGKQCKPEFIRELIGTMKLKNAIMGGLIIEADPSQQMEFLAQKQGQLNYEYSSNLPPQYHDKVQILTVQEIIDGKTFYTPPTLKEIQLYRRKQEKLF